MMSDDDEILRQIRQYFAGRPVREDAALRPDISADDLSRIRTASVLIPFYKPPGHADTRILLTLRPRSLRSHGGQVSLPGGTEEAQDRNAVDTALRECREEIGTPAHDIEVLGQLGAVYLPSGYRVTPVVGILAPDTRITPCPVEVEAVFHAPASLLLDPRNYRRSTMEFRNRPREVLELTYQQYRIWGATAAILHGLGSAITNR